MLKFVLSLLLWVASPVFANDHEQGTKNPAVVPAATAPAAAGTPESSSSSTQASAAGYTCTLSKLRRAVSVAYEKPDSKVPCKVNYVRDVDSGETKVLFSAAAEEGFCEKKATEFVEKLESSGWTCTNR